MSKDCGQVIKPVIDNTTEDCGGSYISSNCVIDENKYEYSGSEEGKKVAEIFQDLVSIINTQGKSILMMSERFAELLIKFKDFKVLEKSGLQVDSVLNIQSNTPFKYSPPDNSKLFAFELLGNTTLNVGDLQNNSIYGSISGGSGSILQVGLVSDDYVWLNSSNDVEILPIIFKQ